MPFRSVSQLAKTGSTRIDKTSSNEALQAQNLRARVHLFHPTGLLKLLYADERYTKEAVALCLDYALGGRHRVKEQLKKLGGMKCYDVHFSYIAIETGVEKFISAKQQGDGSFIPEGAMNPSVLHTVETGTPLLGLYRIETQVTSGKGRPKSFLLIDKALQARAGW